MHPSWLPDYRGGNPILWHIVDNQKSLATSIHRLTDEYDKGAVLAQKRIARPHGASSAELAELTEKVLGRELLSSVIESLNANPEMRGVEQPQKSPTRYAYAKTADALANETTLNEFSAQTLWDLIHYFGFCPAQWLALSGWRKKLIWLPAELIQHDLNAKTSPWSIRAGKTGITLYNNQASIVLKPQYSSLVSLLRSK